MNDDKPWSILAAKIEDYIPGNQWEGRLDRHLQQYFPKLVAQLGTEYQDYLKVQVNRAFEQAEAMEARGVSTETAEELALDDLIKQPPTPEDEAEERESEEEMVAAIAPLLLG